MGCSTPLESTVLLYIACSEKSKLSGTKLKKNKKNPNNKQTKKIEENVDVILLEMLPDTKADAKK